jgi:hypothetical protein
MQEQQQTFHGRSAPRQHLTSHRTPPETTPEIRNFSINLWVPRFRRIDPRPFARLWGAPALRVASPFSITFEAGEDARPSRFEAGEGTKTPCAAHRIDRHSPNFGRSAERPSLTGVSLGLTSFSPRNFFLPLCELVHTSAKRLAVKAHLSVVDTYRILAPGILSPGFLSGLFIGRPRF